MTTPYKVQPERLVLADVEPVKRGRARATCASTAGKFAWLRMEVCVSPVRGPSGTKTSKVASSTDVVEICREFAEKYMNLQEFFGVLCLDSRQQPLGFAVISVGGASSTQVDPKIVFKPVLLSTATAMVVVHNHPSGDPSPSQDDVVLTKRLVDGAKLLGIQLLDHLIVAEQAHFSFLDAGLMR